MGYRSKNTRGSIRKAASEKSVVDDALSEAFAALKRYGETKQDMAKSSKRNESIQQLVPYIQYAHKVQKKKQSEYEGLKSTYSEILSKRQEKDPNIKFNFPTYKDYQKGDFRPSIADDYYNETTLNYIKAGVNEDVMEAIMKGLK